MLKSEAEQMIRRSCEERGKTMDDKEIDFMAEIIMKIASRIVEEAFSTSSTKPNQRGNFFG